ncbi:MAG TPA: DUF928 domain-containing protein [Crinalium sp.]|jgi:hypothetical protein
MFSIKLLLYQMPMGIALASTLAIAFSSPAALALRPTERHQPEKYAAQNTRKQTLPPPPPTNPGSSVAGGRRAPTACPQDAVTTPTDPPLTALIPTTQSGLTLSAHPTFLVYVPKTSAETGEFSLRLRGGQGVYRTAIALTNTPDIISIMLPDQVAPLEINRSYTWSFAVICNPSDRLSDQFVTGTVQRTELDPTRLHQLEQAPVRQRIDLYQESGVWYDALALLLELKRSQPDDPEINVAWHNVLQSGGVNTMIDISPSRPR